MGDSQGVRAWGKSDRGTSLPAVVGPGSPAKGTRRVGGRKPSNGESFRWGKKRVSVECRPWKNEESGEREEEQKRYLAMLGGKQDYFPKEQT